MIAFVSYNPLPKLKEVAKRTTQSNDVYVMDSIFNPKAPENVLESDEQFKTLLLLKNPLTKIIIFVGKASSGSLEMINLFCSHFETKKLFFVCCDHDLEEKRKLFVQNRIPEDQHIMFNDNSALLNRQCNEEIPLMGILTNMLIN